jgi:hypothetical protein
MSAQDAPPARACSPAAAIGLLDLPSCIAFLLPPLLDARSLAALAVAAPRAFHALAEAEAAARLQRCWCGAEGQPRLRGYSLPSLCILARCAPSVAERMAPPACVVLSPTWEREVEAFAAHAWQQHRAQRARRRHADGSADAHAASRLPLSAATLAAFQRAARRGDVTAAEALSFFQRGWRALADALGSPAACARAPRLHPLDFRPQRDAARRGHLPSLLAHGAHWLTGFGDIVPRDAVMHFLEADAVFLPAGALYVMFHLTPRQPSVAVVLLSIAVGMCLMHDAGQSERCTDALTQLGTACELEMAAAVHAGDGADAVRHLAAAVAAYDAAGSTAAVLRLAELLAPPTPHALLAAGVVCSAQDVPCGEVECASPARRGTLLARLMGMRHNARSVTPEEASACRTEVRRRFIAVAERHATPDALARMVPDYTAFLHGQGAMNLVHRLDADAAARSKRQRRADANAAVPRIASVARPPRR